MSRLEEDFERRPTWITAKPTEVDSMNRLRVEAERKAAEYRELLREAEALIDSMATWFRSQPMGCPPAGTAQWQSKARAALGASSVPSPGG